MYSLNELAIAHANSARKLLEPNAEYFPSSKIYGDATVSNPKISKYIKQAVDRTGE